MPTNIHAANQASWPRQTIDQGIRRQIGVLGTSENLSRQASGLPMLPVPVDSGANQVRYNGCKRCSRALANVADVSDRLGGDL
jgi:hypothetical protein